MTALEVEEVIILLFTFVGIAWGAYLGFLSILIILYLFVGGFSGFFVGMLVTDLLDKLKQWKTK